MSRATEEEINLVGAIYEPGWAGLLTLEEATKIGHALALSQKMRRLWKFRKRKRYPLGLIAERAYPEEPEVGRAHLHSLMGGAKFTLEGSSGRKQ